MRLHPGPGVDKGVLDYIGHVHEVQGIGATWALTQAPVPAFWIDTFGIPRHSSAKREAIKRMSDTYRNSSKVLVIDGRLVGGPAGGRARGLHCEIRPVDDILGRILITPWMRRLWTLQEGLLAKELLFMFTEGPVDAQNLVSGVMAERTGPDDSPGALVREQLARGIASLVYFNGSEDCTFKFRTVWNSSVGRTATKPEDISLCLATALGMDASQLYDAAENERSKTFYSLLPLLAVDRGRGITMATIDSSILFSKQEKLPDYGFRWADRELCGESLTPSTEAAIVAGPHIGLLVYLPAAEINLPFAALGRSHWNLQLPGQGQMLEVTVHRRFEHLEQISTEVFFLILENNVDWGKPSAGRSRGLLASLDLRVPRLDEALEQLCIECYVEVSPSECLTSTISDVESDPGGVEPCFKLGDFRDLLVILR